MLALIIPGLRMGGGFGPPAFITGVEVVFRVGIHGLTFHV